MLYEYQKEKFSVRYERWHAHEQVTKCQMLLSKGLSEFVLKSF